MLKYNTQLETNISTIKKLVYTWLGLYYIRTVVLEKGTYILKEFDKTKLFKIYIKNWLKKFIKCKEFYKLIILVENLKVEGEESEK
jgi:hypothetical protein